jgi:hypothetical protein
MADFSTIVTPSNSSLDLYCHSITQSCNSYAVISTVQNTQTVAPSSPQLVDFSLASSTSLVNCSLNGANNAITLLKKGIYLIDFNISAVIPSTAGVQSQLSCLINGNSDSFDIGYAAGEYKSTIKTFAINVTDGTLTTVSFRLSALADNVGFRYAQLSIQKIA